MARRAPLPTSWLVAGVLVIGLAFRLALVSSWHAPAGDGLHYFQLSQELRAHGRFAYGPPPRELTYTRMPGYPLFLAYVAVGAAPVDLDTHLRRATRVNVLCDLGSALLVFLLLLELGMAKRAALAGFAAVIACPLMFLFSCYGLTESLSTFLSTLEVYLALRAMRSRPIAFAAAAGLVAGFALLVRADAAVAAPAVLLGLLFAKVSWPRKLGGAAAFGLCAALVFAPWPIRNLQRFGDPHVGAARWRTQDGRELPDEVFAWTRTWACSAAGEGYDDLLFYLDRPLDVNNPGVLRAEMYDDAAEREEVKALFLRYNRERFTPPVIAGFAKLAHDHFRRHPFRFFVTLPLQRVLHLYTPLPEYEAPMRVRWMLLPQLRGVFWAWDLILYALAIAGAVLLYRRGRGSPDRRWLAVVGSCILARTALFSFAMPHVTTQRYLVEVFPLLLALAVYGGTAVLARLQPRAPN